MIPDQVIVAFLMGLGATVIWNEIKKARKIWETYSVFGEDKELEERLTKLLGDLPQGYYNSEKWIASRVVMKDLVVEGEIPQLQQRLTLLAQRGILEFCYDKTQGNDPEGRLYRLSARQA